METLIAINAIFGILGVSTDIVEKVRTQADKQAQRVSKTSTYTAIPFEQEITELALRVLIDFIWYQKMDVSIREPFGEGQIKPSDGRTSWEQYQYDALEKRLNDKLNVIGYGAVITRPLTADVFVYYRADIKIAPKDTRNFTLNYSRY